MIKFIDALYGSISLEISKEELTVPELQRLRSIRLCNINSPYITGGDGLNRFEHAIGTAYLAQLIAEAYSIESIDKKAFILAALYHDIVTAPFGHSLEYLFEALIGDKYEHSNIWQMFLSGETVSTSMPIYFGKKYSLNTIVDYKVLEKISEILCGKHYLSRILVNDIDIYSMGRRPNILHQKLLALKESKGITYRYDGLSSSALYVKDYRVHRDNLRESLQKSRSFLVFPSKFDVLNQTHGQVEFGFRFFEGAASGTVLIGDIPDSETFKEIFHWEDAVIPLPDNTDDLYRMLGTLDESKERVDRIRKNNIYQCLMYHDWAYRWRQILESVGLEATLGLQEREQRLKDMSAHYVTD